MSENNRFAFERRGSQQQFQISISRNLGGQLITTCDDVLTRVTELVRRGHAVHVDECDGLIHVTHYLSCTECARLARSKE